MYRKNGSITVSRLVGKENDESIGLKKVEGKVQRCKTLGQTNLYEGLDLCVLHQAELLHIDHFLTVCAKAAYLAVSSP